MLLEQITVKNLLSFRDATVDLGPLNILVGENTAGKTNLIEAISLLQALPGDLRAAIVRGGGIRYWLWLGAGAVSPVASLSCRAKYEAESASVDYNLAISDDNGMAVLSESLSGADGKVYLSRDGQQLQGSSGPAFSLDRTSSVFSVLKNPFDPTPVTKLGWQFEKIRIFREFQTGWRSGSRLGISTNVSGDYLGDSGDNLAMVLHELNFRGVHDQVRKSLEKFSSRIEDVKVKVDQGIARAYLEEQGFSERLPAARMSDGTLKFLCLLTVLLHPDPPPLVCIEEPEQGLHPDAIQLLAPLLKDASTRMQLIVTTHSAELIDAFSPSPESVLICERDSDGGTQCRHLSRKKLENWLKRYSLGQLWRKGEIGGNRW
jgi:predicted ATPase